MTVEQDSKLGTGHRSRRFEWTAGPPGLQSVRAREITFPEPLQLVHSEYVVKLTLAGSGAPVRYRGGQYGPCAAGSVTVFEPFEPVISKVSHASTSFVSLLLEPRLVAEASAHPAHSARLRLDAPHVFDKALAREVAAICTDMRSGAEVSLLEERTFSILQFILDCGSEHSMISSTAVNRAREIIMDRISENIPLAEMEQACGMTRFHLSRMFRQRFGMPPHEFRIRARIAIARTLLGRGVSQAEVAQQVGFFDQAHLHRHFSRILGISPGAYQRSLRS